MNGWLIVLICAQVAGVGVALGARDLSAVAGNIIRALIVWGILYMAGIGAIM